MGNKNKEIETLTKRMLLETMSVRTTQSENKDDASSPKQTESDLPKTPT